MPAGRAQIKARLSNGQTVLIEAAGPVAAARQTEISFPDIGKSIAAIVQDLLAELAKIPTPSKVALTFGLEITAETGALVKLVAKGSAKASIELALEWTHT